MSELVDYKTTSRIDWAEVFRKDPDVLNSILSGVAKPKRADKTSRRYAALMLDDYSDRPFKKAVKALLRSDKLGVLVEDMDNPSKSEIEAVAKHFDRHPSYFLEYRVNYVLSSISEFLVANPEVASTWFKKAHALRGIRVK